MHVSIVRPPGYEPGALPLRQIALSLVIWHLAMTHDIAFGHAGGYARGVMTAPGTCLTVIVPVIAQCVPCLLSMWLFCCVRHVDDEWCLGEIWLQQMVSDEVLSLEVMESGRHTKRMRCRIRLVIRCWPSMEMAGSGRQKCQKYQVVRAVIDA